MELFGVYVGVFFYVNYMGIFSVKDMLFVSKFYLKNGIGFDYVEVGYVFYFGVFFVN